MLVPPSPPIPETEAPNPLGPGEDRLCPPPRSAPRRPLKSPSLETNRKRLYIFSGLMIILGGTFLLTHWQAWRSRVNSERALALVQREVGLCLRPEIIPGGSRLATVNCPDMGRSFVVLQGQVLEVVNMSRNVEEDF